MSPAPIDVIAEVVLLYLGRFKSTRVRQEARDLVQDVYVSVWDTIQGYQLGVFNLDKLLNDARKAADRIWKRKTRARLRAPSVGDEALATVAGPVETSTLEESEERDAAKLASRFLARAMSVSIARLDRKGPDGVRSPIYRHKFERWLMDPSVEIPGSRARAALRVRMKALCAEQEDEDRRYRDLHRFLVETEGSGRAAYRELLEQLRLVYWDQ